MRASSSREISRLRQFRVNASSMGAMLVRTPRPLGRRVAWPPRGRLALGAAVSLLAVPAVMLGLDAWSIGWARGLPTWLVWLFEHITDLGLSGWFLWPTGVLLIAIAFVDARSMPRLTRGVAAAVAVRLSFVFLAIAVPGLLVAIVKRLIGRARPWVAADNVWTYSPWIWKPEYASLPSGHATTAFAAAVAIGALWPHLRVFMWSYAVLIAVSRVIVTAHHPSDVLVGAMVGALGALLMRNWFAARRLGFTIGDDGGVRKLAGPSWRRLKTVARRLLTA
jgi:undecaprenyl-diphosphatase